MIAFALVGESLVPMYMNNGFSDLLDGIMLLWLYVNFSAMNTRARSAMNFPPRVTA